MVKFSMLMMTVFLVGLFMFASGLACIFKGLKMHIMRDKDDTLVIVAGAVLTVFGPVITVLSAIYYTMTAKQLRDAGQWC